MFHLKAMIELKDNIDCVVNKKSHAMFKDEFDIFIKECKKSTEKSYDNRFKNPPNTNLKFSEHISLHDEILD